MSPKKPKALVLANPLHYPLAILVAGLLLVISARILRLPAFLALPGAAIVAVAGATGLKRQEPEAPLPPGLARDLQTLSRQVESLSTQAEALRTEASQRLTQADQMDGLVLVQDLCDRAQELPQRIAVLSNQVQDDRALLDREHLQQQLQEANARMKASTGAAREQWQKLSQGLSRNLELARQGQDARQAQVLNLTNLVVDAGGVLQQVQNQLRSADFKGVAELDGLRSLSDQFVAIHDTLDLLAG
jgi:hypothetical protein